MGLSAPDQDNSSSDGEEEEEEEGKVPRAPEGWKPVWHDDGDDILRSHITSGYVNGEESTNIIHVHTIGRVFHIGIGMKKTWWFQSVY